MASGVPAAEGAGSRACAPCHQSIYDTYLRTPMAASAGKVGGGLMEEKFNRATFTHDPTGFRYRVSRNRQEYVFEFEKTQAGTLRGKRTLPYFIGSGAAARSYLLVADGFLYQAPVAYYAGGAKWDLAPGYDRYAYPYLTRPVPPACLTCHASFLRHVAGTQNRFETPPFEEPGVACERCHGEGESHIAKIRSARLEGGSGMVNPSKLAPDRRDSICSQCHLSGEARVMRAGRDWRAFRPGEPLSDSITVFVRSGGSPGMKVTSHVEKLAQSVCKRTAGDRLWCGSCHDPHSAPPPEKRAAWFREKCLRCHEPARCKAAEPARRKSRDDCAGCHMPKNPVVDAQHVVYTDHSIPRRPRPAAAGQAPDAELIEFGGGSASQRDLALAYAIVAQREGSTTYRSRALTLLERAERDAPEDTEVLLYLAELYRTGEQQDRAIPLYERAIGQDPSQVTASVGLGGIRMERGEYREAIRLWEDALAKNAGLPLVRMNLAMAEWRVGDLRSAESNLEKAVDLNPGLAAAAELLQRFRQTPGPR